MNAVYRPMRQQDIEAVCRIEESLFADAWSPAGFYSEIERQGSFAYILEIQDEIIGYTICWQVADEVHIGNVAVKKERQGQGFGNVLMRHILDMFGESNLFILEVRAGNKPAIGLYQKFGFSTLYQRKKYYRDGEDALVMVLLREKE